MKILIISSYQKFGGAEQSAFYLASGLRSLGHETERICHYGNDDSEESCTIIRKTKRILPLPKVVDLLNPFVAYKLKKIVKMKQPDILCFQNINGFAFSLLSLYLLREYPIVWTLHDWWVLGGGTIKTGGNIGSSAKISINQDWVVQFPKLPTVIYHLENFILKHAHPYIVTPTKWLQESLMSSPLLHNLQSSVIPLGIDIDLFHPAEKIQTENHRILYVGRINDRKGYATLMEAFKKVSLVFPDVELWAVGSHKPDHQEGNVKIFHSRSSQELVKFYHQTTLLVSPGVETPGLVSLEALASGIPVITPDIAPIREYLNDSIADFFVYHDANNLADTIINLLRNPTRREEIRKNGPQLMAAKFSNVLMAERYLKLFKEVIARRNQ